MAIFPLHPIGHACGGRDSGPSKRGLFEGVCFISFVEFVLGFRGQKQCFCCFILEMAFPGVENVPTPLESLLKLFRAPRRPYMKKNPNNLKIN